MCKLHTSLGCERLNILVHVLDSHPLHVVVSPADISQTWHWSGADLQCHHHQNAMVCTCTCSKHCIVMAACTCIYLHLLTCSLTLFVLLNALALLHTSSYSLPPSLPLPLLPSLPLSPSLSPSLDCPLSLLHSLTHSLYPPILTLSFPHSQSVWSKGPSSEDAAL